MKYDDNNYISRCIICNGTGKVNCDCGVSKIPNEKCLTCRGEGDFICPICEGEGKL